MTDLTVYSQAPIKLYDHDKLLENSKFRLAYWQYDSDPGRYIWGLTYNDYPTHMSYGMEYCDPEVVVNRDNLFFYFDVGNKLCANRSDLKIAFEELGLLDD